jgi:hypothetical protein
VGQPAHSPDLLPNDYCTSQLKENVGVPRFKNDLGVKTVATRWLIEQGKDFYQQKIQNIVPETICGSGVVAGTT